MRHAVRAGGIEEHLRKRAALLYVAGQPKGPELKWMSWALTVYAVLTYALGHGKRLPLYSDYTFGVWNTRLVPIGNANWDCTDREARAGAGNHFSRLMNQKEKAGAKENPDCRDDDESKREEVQQDPDGFAMGKDFRTKWFGLQRSPELRRAQRAIGAVYNHPPILGGFSCRSEKFSQSTPTPVAKPQLLHRRANSYPRKQSKMCRTLSYHAVAL